MFYNLLINDNEFNINTTGKYKNNILEYSINKETFKINIKKEEFTKINNESILLINKNNCYLTLKSLNKIIEIPINYLTFNQNNNIINIEYSLITNEEPIKIKIEIGSEINV